MMTASYLFAPDKHNPGDNKCFYCGIDCDERYSKKEYVKPTFTNRDIVKYPGSDYVCGCCVESMITGWDVTLIDGDHKTGRSGTPRMYSWVLETGRRNRAFSKRHLDFAREILKRPPDPPFSIIFADSGQKQLIFRAPVNYDIDHFSVLLEEKVIDVHRDIFSDYLNRAKHAAAAIGKKGLSSPDSFNSYKSCIELYGSELPLVEWLEIYSSPLGELAAWTCPGKDECRNDSIVSRRFQKETGRDNRPAPEITGDGRKGDKRRGDQVLLDFT